MADLFKDILPSIREHKEVLPDEEVEEGYVPWLVNYALSFHMDTVFQANEMNMYPELPKLMQYRYYMASVRGQKRPFFVWPKKPKNEVLLSIMHFWQVSRSKAEEYAKVLNEAQHKELLKMWESIQDGKARSPKAD